jgi:hypothetical protein
MTKIQQARALQPLVFGIAIGIVVGLVGGFGLAQVEPRDDTRSPSRGATIGVPFEAPCELGEK